MTAKENTYHTYTTSTLQQEQQLSLYPVWPWVLGAECGLCTRPAALCLVLLWPHRQGLGLCSAQLCTHLQGPPWPGMVLWGFVCIWWVNLNFQMMGVFLYTVINSLCGLYWGSCVRPGKRAVLKIVYRICIQSRLMMPEIWKAFILLKYYTM